MSLAASRAVFSRYPCKNRAMDATTHWACSSRQFRIDRQGQGLPGRGFAFGEVAFASAKVRETLLQVQGHRIVDFRADALFLEISLQCVAPFRANDKLVVDVAVARRLERQLHQPVVGQSGRLEQAAIAGGVRLPGGRPLVEMAELDGDDRRLQRVEAEIAADRGNDSISASSRGRAGRAASRPRAASLVVTSPPSPAAPRFFEGKKLKQP